MVLRRKSVAGDRHLRYLCIWHVVYVMDKILCRVYLGCLLMYSILICLWDPQLLTIIATQATTVGTSAAWILTNFVQMHRMPTPCIFALLPQGTNFAHVV